MSNLLRRLGVVAAAVLLPALLLAGCGHRKTGDDAQALLKQTFTGTHRVDSGRVAVGLSVTTAGRSGLDLRVDGPFQRGRTGEVPQLALRLAGRSPKSSVDAGVTTTSSQFFLRQRGQDYVLPQAAFKLLQQSYRASAAQSGGQTLLGRLGVALKWLRNPRVAGDADVGGAPTRHITSGVDVRALLDDLSALASRAQALPLPSGQIPSFSPGQRARLEKAIKSSSVDVFTGRDDKTLRRFVVNLELVASAQNGSSAALPPTSVSLSLELTGLNQPQRITAPAHAKPLNQAPGGGGLGGLGGTAGT